MPDMMYQPWCIRYLEWEQPQPYEHKSNTQQFGIRGSPTSKIVNEVVAVDNQRLENKIIELTSLIRQLAIGQHHNSPLVRVCGIYQPPPPFRPQQPMQPVQQSSLEELVKQMATNNIQFQENVSATIQDLQTQIGQLATIVNQLQFKGFGHIPSHTILSPQENMSDITFRSGKELPQ
ncbi:hypothetical protein CR513_51148, partial [Mucuna pruriens]